jgi:solute:Na+ symporter, SSS family
MNSISILFVVGIYSLLLFVITWYTARNAGNAGFFKGNNQSPWYIIAYGMIGASLSGVTFMSVPGWVGTTQFSYMMVVFGYLAGYTVIATVLLPLYYRLNLTSIYTFLEQRFGFWSYKTGAFYFLLSRTIGASFRMFLVVTVLQTFVFDSLGVPFWITVLIFVCLILLYTYEGGIKTIIWTDTLQTTFMLLSVIISVFLIKSQLNMSFSSLIDRVSESGYLKMINTDVNSKQFWVKQFFSGMFISIVMTGLDQEMMQKNLSCKNLKDAQKNMFSFSFVLVFVNLLFLFLGALLYIYSQELNISIPARTDELFPSIAIEHLGTFAGLIFIIGLISAAYPSADGALTSLTTSVCIDFLGFQSTTKLNEEQKKKTRVWVHVSFAFVLLLVIIIFRAINDQAVVSKLFTVAGYTYGPLLGLYSFGLFSKRKPIDKFVPLVCLLSPIICYILNVNSKEWLAGYEFGFELLILNGLITFIGLWFLSIKIKKTISL